jgi:hypothetical protein
MASSAAKLLLINLFVYFKILNYCTRRNTLTYFNHTHTINLRISLHENGSTSQHPLGARVHSLESSQEDICGASERG